MHEGLLFWSLFFPRISLLVSYSYGVIPPNSVPFLADVILAALIPRFLILFYIATTMGICNWFWAHFVSLILVELFTILRSIGNK